MGVDGRGTLGHWDVAGCRARPSGKSECWRTQWKFVMWCDLGGGMGVQKDIRDVGAHLPS